MEAVTEEMLEKINKQNHRKLLGCGSLFCVVLKNPGYEVVEVQMLTLI